MIRALISIGIPYADALQMPVQLALAMLDSGRQKNHRNRQSDPDATKLVATRRKSKEPKP